MTARDDGGEASLDQILRQDRQMTHTLARRRKHRICHRRGNWRDSHFADPRGRRITFNKVDVDPGRLVKTQRG